MRRKFSRRRASGPDRGMGTPAPQLRFAAMIGSSLIWPAMGGLALAVGVGVQLGQSAVGQINPVYFKGAALHPRERGAALDPNALQSPQPAFAQAYGWDAGNAARALDCGGCDRGEYPYAPDLRPAAEPALNPRPIVVDLTPWEPGEVAAPRDADIARFTDYPIEEKPVVEAQVDEPEAPVE